MASHDCVAQRGTRQGGEHHAFTVDIRGMKRAPHGCMRTTTTMLISFLCFAAIACSSSSGTTTGTSTDGGSDASETATDLAPICGGTQCDTGSVCWKYLGGALQADAAPPAMSPCRKLPSSCATTPTCECLQGQSQDSMFTIGSCVSRTCQIVDGHIDFLCGNP